MTKRRKPDENTTTISERLYFGPSVTDNYHTNDFRGKSPLLVAMTMIPIALPIRQEKDKLISAVFGGEEFGVDNGYRLQR